MDSESKQCGCCSQTLPLNNFYQIKGSDEKNVRWEKVCKACKRKRRLAKPDQAKSNPETVVVSVLPAEAKNQVRYRDDGEIIYKEYKYPNGEILQLTKEEFERVVDIFRMLDAQDRKINGPPAA